MKHFHIFLLTIYFSNTQSSIYGDIKNNGQLNSNNKLKNEPLVYFRERNDPEFDVKRAHFKSRIMQRARQVEDEINHGKDIPANKIGVDPKIDKQYYHMDPVLNHVKRRLFQHQHSDSSSSSSSSSSLEMKYWKDEFQEEWMKKKYEALNTTFDAPGDIFNMAAARPWGVPCGDPNQHDMPWGTCMLPQDCDAEYRIYRGDSFCGRTEYVCCSLQLTNYDMYQGFDVSFADSSFATDSEEKKKLDSREEKKRKRHQNRKRRKQRKRRKRKMMKTIRNIVREMKKILNRSFRNASHHRKRKTKLLKKYIKDLKKKYKRDRKSIRDIHEADIERIDATLAKKLDQIRSVNKNFILNDTFREIVVNGTIDKKGARMLAEAYPELTSYLPHKLRRDDGGLPGKGGDYLEYDIEYGAFYY